MARPTVLHQNPSQGADVANPGADCFQFVIQYLLQSREVQRIERSCPIGERFAISTLALRTGRPPQHLRCRAF
jgi:hypothetical protein